MAIRVENVQFEVVDGNRLVIYVDLNHRGDISASGKTRRVASTEGNVECALPTGDFSQKFSTELSA